MVDKSLGIFLMALFGVSGVIILAVAWMWSMPVSERILTVLVGSVGLFVAGNRALVLKALQVRTKTGAVSIEVKGDDKS